jgi:hypothetical protein
MKIVKLHDLVSIKPVDKIIKKYAGRKCVQSYSSPTDYQIITFADKAGGCVTSEGVNADTKGRLFRVHATEGDCITLRAIDGKPGWGNYEQVYQNRRSLKLEHRSPVVPFYPGRRVKHKTRGEGVIVCIRERWPTCGVSGKTVYMVRVRGDLYAATEDYMEVIE